MKKVGTKEIKVIYEYCKKVFNGSYSPDYASTILHRTLNVNTASAKMYFDIYRCMLSGATYKRATSHEMTEYFILSIYKEKGAKAAQLAIDAVGNHRKYYKRVTGTGIRGNGLIDKMCKQLRYQLV